MQVGKIYNIFPAYIEEDGEVYSFEDAWEWKYFSWLFYTIRFIIQRLSTLMDLEPFFVISMEKKKTNVR